MSACYELKRPHNIRSLPLLTITTASSVTHTHAHYWTRRGRLKGGWSSTLSEPSIQQRHMQSTHTHTLPVDRDACWKRQSVLEGAAEMLRKLVCKKICARKNDVFCLYFSLPAWFWPISLCFVVLIFLWLYVFLYLSLCQPVACCLFLIDAVSWSWYSSQQGHWGSCFFVYQPDHCFFPPTYFN